MFVAAVLSALAPSLAQNAPSPPPTPYQFRDANLHHIPDYDVLSLTFPPDLWQLAIAPRDDYLAKINQDPLPLQNLRLLLGLGEFVHETSTENLNAYFDNPAATLS